MNVCWKDEYVCVFLYLCPHDRSRDKVVGALHDICLNLQPNLERLKPSKLLLYKLPPLLLPHTHLSKHEPGREHVWIKTVGRCPSVSTPTVSPSIPLKTPRHREGMFGGPHPDAWGLKGGMFTLFYALLTRSGVSWVSTSFKPKKSDWGPPPGVFIVLGCRGQGPESTGTLRSVSTGLPLIVWMNRLTGDPEALNCTLCDSKHALVSL